ncbi:hypothetical protein IEN85_09385 [Pelagicoccus sp. NFK12]|uniref:Uncharacterized protein n=1 Tax=Pelagicoccus enzymogenes TaxID=2773457 RepID=A0A927F9H6_9BACT|nr:hypothetical protein [Pelagicoccus enzymogenes]MBD5779706.1 hypothetical protein [Pelagicoccus enzymogenes]
MTRERRGFAIVLVAALAGLIFLLGASLVVVTRLQTAAASYDQRVRLAREHARAALDIAIAELQEEMGKDIAVSFTADTLSAAEPEDFKAERIGAAREPFWTGASQGSGNVNWLVTRKLDGTTALPTGAFSGGEVELLGEGTVGDNPLLKVKVPTESIAMKGVDGFADDSARTIGNYGYWIGDLGVKASYAWYDQLDEVAHDNYIGVIIDPDPDVPDDEYILKDQRDRLRQMTISKPEIETVDTNDESTTPTNPVRIESLVSDFQFRSDFGDTSSDDLQDDRYLIDLEQANVEDFFHDFTPLSKGLMVDSENGGLKLDLSLAEPPSGSVYNQAYKAYSNFHTANLASYDQFDDFTYSLRTAGVESLGVLPAITQFNLNYAIYFSSIEAGPSDISVSVEASVELWNPYVNAIEFSDGNLDVLIEGLPTSLSVWLNDGTPEGAPNLILNSVDLPSALSFSIDSISDASKRMRAGEITLLSGPLEDGSGGVLYELASGTVDLTRAVVHTSSITLPEALSHFYVKVGLVGEASDVDLSVKLRDEGSDLLVYSPTKFVLSKTLFENPAVVTPPRFGFSWEFDDLAFPLGETTQLFDLSLDAAILKGWEADAAADVNINPVFSTAADVLFGETSTLEASKSDFPLLKLPKQALTNVGQLSVATGVRRDALAPLIGEAFASSDQNSFFDQYFFSSIPPGTTAWDFGDSLPNTNYRPRSGVASYTADSAQDLWVHGMFNVHSTSTDAWEAILKGSPVSQHPYWKDILPDGTFLFMNHPLGGEDMNVLDPGTAPTIESLEAIRLSLKKNAFSLTEAQVEELAKLIVKEIRGYVGASPNNPFDSLEEFVDSGVLQDAIEALDSHEETTLRINPSWVIPGTPAEFRQSTILNLISGILSVRSDTFLVRAYGDAVDPADPTNVWAKAYCEAIVQRTHEEYGDDVPASTADIDRKFEVVAFRWLSPSEI